MLRSVVPRLVLETVGHLGWYHLVQDTVSGGVSSSSAKIAAEKVTAKEMRGSKKVRPTKIMERSNGKMYLGSVELPYVGVVSASREQ